MNEVEKYVDSIVANLPFTKREKLEMKEEMMNHIEEHIAELIETGYSKHEAISHALQSFGDEKKIHEEMKRTIFPFYKTLRFIWTVSLLTLSLFFLSNFVMSYYEPHYVITHELSLMIFTITFITLISGVGELVLFAITDMTKDWLKKPWMLPIILVVIFSILIFRTWQVSDELIWIDSATLPLSALLYVLFRELFQLIFIPLSKAMRILNR